MCSYKVHKTACGQWPVNNFDTEQWHMHPDLVRPLVYRLKEADVRYMVVTGGGEPLLNHKVTIEALRVARVFGIQTGLYTNGSVLAPHVEDVLAAGPRFVRVSINAGSEPVHTAYHRPLGRSLYQDVLDGTEKLARVRAETGAAAEIGLSYIVNEWNREDIYRFGEWVALVATRYANGRPGIDFVRFTPTIDYFTHRQYPSAFFEPAMEAIGRVAEDLLRPLGVQTTAFTRFAQMAMPKDYEECVGCGWYAEVGPDGCLYVCCEMNTMPGYRLGDLLRRSIESIWHSDEARRVIERINKSRLQDCPVFCKPHNLNRIAHALRRKVAEEPDGVQTARAWIESLHALHEWSGSDGFVKQRTVAF
jgi:MoaA/NifB/PqqE/SkfB family radical SAM enzyme